jgi:DNA-binding transcriptional MerR regulator
MQAGNQPDGIREADNITVNLTVLYYRGIISTDQQRQVMMDSSEYTIQELSELSGVPRRNIHFYTQQGILPPPQGAGLGARYTQLHLLRLRSLPILRSQGLRLDQIRQRLETTDPAELQALVAQPQPANPAIHPVFPPQPTGESYTHYRLPAGISLVAPANLSFEDRRRLEALLQAARTLFQPGPVRPLPPTAQE